MEQHYDVVVVGGGLSGVCAGAYLRRECPDKTFAILERRERLGGTWDLFRYPGIRSDSDMYTLGFSFFPWRGEDAIADGESIREYVVAAAKESGAIDHLQTMQSVDKASWSSEDNLWTLTVRDLREGETHQVTCSFLWACSGYYRYDHGYRPDFEGESEFEGEIIHPQSWPDDLEWQDKRIVVIGSGATAVTLVPSLAERAAHVTMLQRSPTYIISRPQQDRVSTTLSSLGSTGRRLARWKNVLEGTASYELARKFPSAARKILLSQVKRQVGAEQMEHFSPSYDPWDQRLCLVPDGDLFRAINAGKADVVTEHIQRFVPRGVELKDGRLLEADIIVTATGLELQIFGGCEVTIDGDELRSGERYLYKGAMLSGVPNCALSIGYTNASWTLKCELISGYVCRLLKHLDVHGLQSCCPRRPDDVDEQPLIDFNSGYIERARAELPAQGERLPWRLYQNYLFDQYLFRHSPLEDGALEFS